MNKRFCKLGTYAARAFFLFAVCGATYSCSDDYTLDDSYPTWLGSSIYDYLESKGNYTNFVRLVNELGDESYSYKDVLSHTGSKTLFVANDEAFNDFYQNNRWGVRSYEELTISQKRILLNSSMVNNAYLLEMMSSMEAGSGDNASPEKGQALRRETALAVTDSIPHLFAEDLPNSYNADDKDYWEKFRNNGKGIYLALDGTPAMMTHFLDAQLANKNITDEDFSIITGRTREQNDAFIYDCKVIEKDITCQNGYLNRLDKVLINPQNMAEVLRTSGKTNIFSHMIDRFAAPFPSDVLTDNYGRVNTNFVKSDSVYEKRYFSLNSKGTRLETDPNGDPVSSNGLLKFDPGWNAYRGNDGVMQDMAAMFCPTDEKLMEYFFSENGGGRFLIRAYAPDMLDKVDETTTNIELVYQAIDQIPRDIINALLSNLMKESFVSTVPSKFETIKNDAQDAMFDEQFNYHRDKVLGVLLANNGVIYLMDEVTTPARYAAVSAPSLVDTDKHIFNWAIERETLGGNTPTYYYAYLLAMSSRFSFFVPQDEEFWYIDPLSFYNPEKTQDENGTILMGRAYHYIWDSNNASNSITVQSYKYLYDITNNKGEIGERVSNENIQETCWGNRLKDMLETHTIIHEDNTETTGIDETQTGVECDKHYFYTKNNAVLYVENADKRTNGMVVKGGWQIDNKDSRKVIGFDDKSAQTNGYGNGFAYMIDQPLIPTIESVFSIMYNNPDFAKFFELCQTEVDVLAEIGITGNEQQKYMIFSNRNGLPCYDKTTGDLAERATNVRFFNNFRYTVYIPTNEAIEAAEAKGLPTWQSIRDYLGMDTEEERPDLTDEQKAKATAMVTTIVNFVKNHIQDNSVFADASALVNSQYETATVNSETGIYNKISVSSEGSGILSVTDVNGKLCNTTNNCNLIARDYVTTNPTSLTNSQITSSSSAVIHGIDGVLDYKSYTSGRYDEDWATEAKARAYLKQYQLLK